MNRLELFIAGCKAGRWRWRHWRISLFSVTRLPINVPTDGLDDEELELLTIYEPEVYDIDYRADGIYWYTEDKEWALLEGEDPNKPLYNNRELAKFPALTCMNQPEALETTYGRMLYNFMVITYAFGTKIPFFHKGRSKDVVKLFVSKVVDDDYVPKEGELVFFASEVNKYVKASYELPSLSPYIVTTGTARTLITDPKVETIKAELLAKYGNGRKLTLEEITNIQDTLIKMDTEWLAQDESKDYYIDAKSISEKRNRLFLMFGVEASFQEDGSFVLIDKPLYKGVDMNNLPAVYNSIRDGTLARGMDTALGGEKVNFLQRVYQNTKIIPGDCGTKLHYRFIISELNYQAYLTLNMLTPTGYVELTEEVAKANFGKVIAIRRPLFCSASHTDFCEVCSGKVLSRSPRSVASNISDVGSDIMYAFMSAMHVSGISMSKFIPSLHIR